MSGVWIQSAVSYTLVNEGISVQSSDSLFMSEQVFGRVYDVNKHLIISQKIFKV